MPTIITSTAPAIGGKKAAFLVPADAAGPILSGADALITDLQVQLATLMGPVGSAGSAAYKMNALAAGDPKKSISVSNFILDEQMTAYNADVVGGGSAAGGSDKGPGHEGTLVSPVALAAARAANPAAVATDANPNNNLKFGQVFDQLFSKMYKPTSVKDFVERLSEVNRLALAEGIAEPGAAASAPGVYPSLKDKSVSSVITELEKIGAFKEFLRGFRPASAAPYIPALSINDNKNLSLLLANPAIASIVMEERRKKTLAAFARPVAAMGWGPFGGVAPPISMTFRGGANAALASVDPFNYDPIEMRGAGPMLAAMRGGVYVVGTTSSPTQWRPIDDNSFISASLEAAIGQLKANIAQHQGANLDTAVENTVARLIKELKDAEKAVRVERDKITTMNNAIATGYKPTGTVNTDDITAATESYNAAMKNRQKLENKLFRVVIALGGKQVYP